MNKSEKPDFFFVGTHPGVIDNNSRISIPSEFRHALKKGEEDTLVLAPGNNSVLYVFTPAVYYMYWKLDKRLRAELMKEGRFESDMAIHASSTMKTLDKNGRITLSKEIIKKLGFKREIVILGRLDYFIIRDKEEHESYQKKASFTTEKAWDKFEQFQETAEDI